MTIYKTTKSNCFGKNAVDNININSCDHLQRMLIGIKYYQLLNLHQNPSNNDIFIDFCQRVYVELLNDYQHIISTHSQQLELIHDQIINDTEFGECDHRKCQLFTRYYDNIRRRKITSASSSTTKTDSSLSFFCEIMDIMHHWLLHLFVTAMRVKTNTVISNDENKTQNDDKCIDKDFETIKKEIYAKRDKLNINDDRFNNDMDKFTLNVVSTTKTTEDNKQLQEGITMIDSLFNHLKTSNVSIDTIKKLDEYFKNEQYDTDSICNDIIDSAKGSNIINLIKDNKPSIPLIIDYIEELKSMSILQNYCTKYESIINTQPQNSAQDTPGFIGNITKAGSYVT